MPSCTTYLCAQSPTQQIWIWFHWMLHSVYLWLQQPHSFILLLSWQSSGAIAGEFPLGPCQREAVLRWGRKELGCMGWGHTSLVPRPHLREERVWWCLDDPSGFINIDYFLERIFPPPITLQKTQSIMQWKSLTTSAWWHSTFWRIN